MAKYIISIDQSTQGTKALLFDETGSIMRRTDRPHRQIINEKGWVSHDPEEIYSNVLEVVKELLEGVEKEYVVLCTCGKGWRSRADPPENRNESFPLFSGFQDRMASGK